MMLDKLLLHRGDRAMWKRWISTAAICLAIASQAEAGEFHRVSCAIVRI
jgi:hypothetical protein